MQRNKKLATMYADSQRVGFEITHIKWRKKKSYKKSHSWEKKKESFFYLFIEMIEVYL